MLVWIIGKPGSGKTTVGKLLTFLLNDAVYYSFSSLLKEYQPEITKTGFTQDARDGVYSFLSNISKEKTVIVSGNPYTKSSFLEMSQVNKDFIVFNFEISDSEALRRTLSRGRGLFVHDGKTEQERLDNFNKNVLPEIREIVKNEKVYTINVENKTPEEVAKIIEEMNVLN